MQFINLMTPFEYNNNSISINNNKWIKVKFSIYVFFIHPSSKYTESNQSKEFDIKSLHPKRNESSMIFSLSYPMYIQSSLEIRTIVQYAEKRFCYCSQLF